MTVLDYCINNIQRIENFNQNPFSSNPYRKYPFLEIEQFKDCISEIPILISRESIIEAFRKDEYYKAFLMSMIWGGISKMPTKNTNGDKRSSNAFKAFSIDKTIIEERLSIIKERIKCGDIDFAYNSLQNEYKIPGIDVSFFTKLLSFISESIDESQNLLIYDKWTKLIHVTLLFDLNEGEKAIELFGENRLSELYALYNGKFVTGLIYPKNNYQFEAFIDYCEKLDSLTKNISQATNIIISPFVLESFLFGNQLRGRKNRNDLNPRYWVQQHFANDYLPILK